MCRSGCYSANLQSWKAYWVHTVAGAIVLEETRAHTEGVIAERAVELHRAAVVHQHVAFRPAPRSPGSRRRSSCAHNCSDPEVISFRGSDRTREPAPLDTGRWSGFVVVGTALEVADSSFGNDRC